MKRIFLFNQELPVVGRQLPVKAWHWQTGDELLATNN
jgi:hypothetical protein